MENFSVKLGRQELNYDNFRFLGNLDWAFQGRAHDFALLKYEEGAMKLHAGGGYNQDGQRLKGTFFAMPNQYKIAQFVRYENKWGNFNMSALFWNNGLQFSRVDENENILEEGVRYRQTIGLPTIKYQLGNTTLSGFYYQQLGEDVAGRKVQAFVASAQISHLFSIDPERSKSFRITAGFEILSGNDSNSNEKNRAFTPSYGTNHAHNGYMDLFYVGGRHENSVGLQDLFIRTRFDLNSSLFLSANGHSFSSYANVYREGVKLDKHLGYEADLALGYILNKSVSLQAGYSQVFATNTLEHLQNLQDPAAVQNWGYLMMIYRPTMSNRFIGLLF
ncbi:MULTISPECIES: alginate export family protein [Antarcticibacterium]|uniref:alginate export family protein n=1 Tax=Antarcticibacterium TaxID=2058174 RepID=UPI001C555526|nr:MULTISPECIES: alginate export family protein [Antarcticibacterium]